MTEHSLKSSLHHFFSHALAIFEFIHTNNSERCFFFVVIISSQAISSSKISLWDSTNRSNRNGPIGIYTASRRLRKKVHPFVFVLVKTRWGGLLCWIPLPWDRCYAAENTASCRFRRMRSSWEIKMWDNRRELHFRSYNIFLQRSWTIFAVKLTLFSTKLYIYISFFSFIL